MSIMDILKLLLFIIVGSGLGTFFTQKLFEHRLDKKLYRFSQLYTDKLDVIKNLYRLLVQAETALGKLLSEREPESGEEREKFRSETIIKMDEFLKFFDENEIFMEDAVIKIVEEIRRAFNDAKNKHLFATLMEEHRGTEAWHNVVTRKDELRKKLVNNEMPELKKKLKEEFQRKYRLLEL